MPLYTIRRAVGAASREDIDASAFRALACAIEYPGMRWIRSYWDREAGVLTCLYEAHSAAEIQEHSRRSRIACDEVREVTEFGPEDYAGLAPLPALASDPA